MRVHTLPENRIPIKSWCEVVESGAMEQAHDLAKLPFAFSHIALMPDCHQGYGMPIGGVMATTSDVVVPNAVGVDIGCGMQVLRTNLTDIDTDTIKLILSDIRKCVPIGFNHHKEKQENILFDASPDIPVVQHELESARKQLGTLGGGNHFIEIQGGSDGYIWIMIHSGSRNFGYKIAKTYHEIAKEACAEYYSDIPNTDLSFLPTHSRHGKEYIEAMNFALGFAFNNRCHMMENVKECFVTHTECLFSDGDQHDIHHNYAAMENHFGKNVMVHRKGATLARKDHVGIIPGSQGTSSFIVRGLGNSLSFDSCSHGAGRAMGRKQAQRELNLEKEQKMLESKGIIHSVRSVKQLDEAPSAYKNIDTVMAAQSDLVEIIHTLRPLAVIKG